MDFISTLKGAVAEAAIAHLLRQAGDTVVPTGVEAVHPVLQSLPQGRYLDLDVPREVRLAPDLLLLPQRGSAVLLEVKYRSRIDLPILRSLGEKVRAQQAAFPTTVTVLMRGSSPSGEHVKADDLIRIVPPHAPYWWAAAEMLYHQTTSSGAIIPEGERLEPFWRALPTMTATFESLKDQPALVESLVPVLGLLSRL